MYSSIYLKRFRRLLILGAVVAGLTAAAAGAGTGATVVDRPPYLDDAAGAATPATVVDRPPTLREIAAQKTTETPDVFERYAAAHPYGAGLTSSETARGVEADGLRWQGIAKTYQQLGTSDNSSGFDWNYAIGIGSGMGLVLLVGGLMVVGRMQRGHHVQAA